MVLVLADLAVRAARAVPEDPVARGSEVKVVAAGLASVEKAAAVVLAARALVEKADVADVVAAAVSAVKAVVAVTPVR